MPLNPNPYADMLRREMKGQRKEAEAEPLEDGAGCDLWLFEDRTKEDPAVAQLKEINRTLRAIDQKLGLIAFRGSLSREEVEIVKGIMESKGHGLKSVFGGL